jgi:predicted PhzF superfamily epimerase YddE/YHI9
MPVPLFQVDAFTAVPYRGNPAAVCLLPSPRDVAWMQAVAAEMNLAETAFLEPRADGFDLRWFTPAVEIELCGHATLASAHVLWEDGALDAATPARFHTRSGVLTCERRDGWIEMDFPTEPAAPCEPLPALLAALRVAPKWVGRNRFDYLVEVDSAATVRALAPDLVGLATVECRGVIVTAAADVREHDFVSRFFAPRAGIPEDPVTGSAHCCLGPLWSARLGKAEVVGYQASARGGLVRVRPRGSRVTLAGQAVTVLRGHLV